MTRMRRRSVLLERAYKIGKEAGLRYIYVGNVPGSKYENTFCYNCGEELIAACRVQDFGKQNKG